MFYGLVTKGVQNFFKQPLAGLTNHPMVLLRYEMAELWETGGGVKCGVRRLRN